MTLIGSAWPPYGLTRDPYFQEALDPLPGGSYPTNRLFVGRQEEIEILARQILGAPSSRAIIEGERGVGKTTVVSKLKAELAALGVLTHEKPVRVTAGMMHHEFAADVLRKLLQIRITLNNASNNTSSDVLNPPRESDADAKFWLRVQHLVEGEAITNIGGSIAGVGLGASRTRIAAERPLVSLFDELAVGFEKVANRMPRPDGNGGVLVHVNNLENLTRNEKSDASALMIDLRDYFLIKHSHWVFVGANDIGTTVFGDPAVRSIIPLDVTLAPLMVDDVIEMLDRRYDYVRSRARDVKTRRHHQPYLAPIAREAIPDLYRRYGGNLRGFLRLLSMAVQRYPFAEAVHSLSASEAIQSVSSEYRRGLLKQLGETDVGYIDRTIALTQSPRFRNADVAAATRLKVSSAKQFIERLLANRAVLEDGTAGRSTYYRLAGDALTAFGM